MSLRQKLWYYQIYLLIANETKFHMWKNEVQNYFFLGSRVLLNKCWYFHRGEMANAIETIVLLKWMFILKSHHLFDSGWTPPNGHPAYCAQPFPEMGYLRRMKALAQMVLETSIRWLWFDFGIFSWLGNCQHDMWQTSHLQHSRHRKGPLIAPEGWKSRW